MGYHRCTNRGQHLKWLHTIFRGKIGYTGRLEMMLTEFRDRPDSKNVCIYSGMHERWYEMCAAQTRDPRAKNLHIVDAIKMTYESICAYRP